MVPRVPRRARKGALQLVSCVVLIALGPRVTLAQSYPLLGEQLGDTRARAGAMRRLASDVLATYRDTNRLVFLDNTFRLDIVAGRYDEALAALAALHRRVRMRDTSAVGRAAQVQYEMYARAESLQTVGHVPFATVVQRAFDATVGRLDDRTSGLVVRALLVPSHVLQSRMEELIAAQVGRSEITRADAIALLRADQAAEAYRRFAPLMPALVGADDQRRYILERDVRVPARDGGTICAEIVRPRSGPSRLPTLLEFTIYADSASNMSEARRSASSGYIGVVGLTRGKGCSPGTPDPYRHDGPDAATLIEWISRRPWSDGRVGMYSGSYNGFTQWAAAKYMPKALKALMPAVAAAPGIDVPMDGNVFWNFVYPWPFYTTDNKELDNATYGDTARWNRLYHNWYVSGRAYRDLDRLDGTPNPIFDRWVAHPSYDAYWQTMIPHEQEFARITIPVLQTAGYYYGGPGAAVYYFSQHYAHNPHAEHYLLIGPYDHFGGQRGVVDALGDTTRTLAGYTLDSAARLDLTVLRYQWFDYVFKGGPRPALLADRVNYEVMGANVWKHAPSLKAMGDTTFRFYLSAPSGATRGRLTDTPPIPDGFVMQRVDFADRSDANRESPGGAVADTAIDTWNGLQFVSAPFATSTEVSGLFSGHLELVTNKRDFDFQVQLYERTPGGTYIQLAPYWARASYVGHLSDRHLLTPDVRQHFDFQSVRLMSRLISAGSRLIAVLTILKGSDREINYGTGKPVADETVADAGEPLVIKWSSTSFFDIPASRDHRTQRSSR